MVDIDGSGGGYDYLPFYFVGYLAGVRAMSEIDTLKKEYKTLVGLCEKMHRYIVVEAMVHNELGPILDGKAVTDSDRLYAVKMHVRAAKIRKLWL